MTNQPTHAFFVIDKARMTNAERDDPNARMSLSRFRSHSIWKTSREVLLVVSEEGTPLACSFRRPAETILYGLTIAVTFHTHKKSSVSRGREPRARPKTRELAYVV